MAIFALTLNLKDDQRLVAEYLYHHRHIWPEVLTALQETGIEDIKIYLSGRRLFMVMVAPDGFDPERSFVEYRKNPVADRWDTLMKTYQEQVPEAGPDQWWLPMTPVFDLAAEIEALKGGGERLS
jgi:L-rhamnose mutarotase